MSDKKTGLRSRVNKLKARFSGLRRYSFLAFLVFVALIYGVVLLRVNNLQNIQPSDDAVTKQVKAAQAPRIDENVVQQLKSLQDNSVSVQALFEEARSNPFQ